MSKLEKDIERKVVEYAKLLGFLTFKFTAPNTRGVPDRLFINPHGICLFMELKRPQAKPRRNQDIQIRKLRDQQVPVCVADNVEFACQFLDTWRDRLDTRL